MRTPEQEVQERENRMQEQEQGMRAREQGTQEREQEVREGENELQERETDSVLPPFPWMERSSGDPTLRSGLRDRLCRPCCVTGSSHSTGYAPHPCLAVKYSSLAIRQKGWERLGQSQPSGAGPGAGFQSCCRLARASETGAAALRMRGAWRFRVSRCPTAFAKSTPKC